LERQPAKHHLRLSFHPATWCVLAFVAWGVWNATTDCLPFNENQARPSWYVYGWPACFATSSRGRLNLHRIDVPALIVDLTIIAVVIACTIFFTETQTRRWLRLSILDLFAIVTGSAVALFVWSEAFYWPFEFVLGESSRRYFSTTIIGGIVLTSRFPISVILPLSLGLFAVGWALVEVPFLLVYRRRQSANNGYPD
jgi:hypothetical protein